MTEEAKSRDTTDSSKKTNVNDEAEETEEIAAVEKSEAIDEAAKEKAKTVAKDESAEARHISEGTTKTVLTASFEDVSKDEIDEDIVEAASEKLYYTRYNYSILARLHQAPEASILHYNQLKNDILSYEGVKASMSWKYESFIYKGRTAVKIALHGKTMRVYFDLDYAELDNTKYNVFPVTSRIHQTTPVMIKVRGKNGLKHALELVTMTFAKLKAVKLQEPDNIDYRLPYLDRDTLVEKNLVKKVISTKKQFV